jgi:hypothetical protein
MSFNESNTIYLAGEPSSLAVLEKAVAIMECGKKRA